MSLSDRARAALLRMDRLGTRPWIVDLKIAEELELHGFSNHGIAYRERGWRELRPTDAGRFAADHYRKITGLSKLSKTSGRGTLTVSIGG